MVGSVLPVGGFPDLVEVKPRERLVFHSDFWEVDERVATIMVFVHDAAARDDFGPFWGVNRIPFGLGADVTTILLDQVSRRGEKWVDDHLKSAENISGIALREAASDASTAKGRRRASRTSHDVEETAAEIVNGASYLQVQSRMMVVAPDLATLDRAVSKLRRLYVDRFGTLSVSAQHGRQRRELTELLSPNELKPGGGQGYTSTEYAGAYSLVTNGLADPAGSYVGFMQGDVNNSAVLFDVDDYPTRAVVATGLVRSDGAGGSQRPEARAGGSRRPGRRTGGTTLLPGSGLWGVKASQSALLAGHRVVHVVLDGFPVTGLGADLSSLTSTIDLSRGDVNPLELFGRVEDELDLFSLHLEKLGLLVEQLHPPTEVERSVLRGSLREILTQFYVDKNMWARDARAQRGRLRLVGLDHRQVPVLHDLATYFESAYLRLARATARDEEALHAASVLRSVVRDMLDTHGDLFNNTTSPGFDGRDASPRVVYDLSSLGRRGPGVQMAQLVNVANTAVAGLGADDVLVLHGCERIERPVWGYLARVLEELRTRGARVLWLYGEATALLAQAELNRFEAADWTVLGGMSALELGEYQTRLGVAMPPDLVQLVEGATGRVHLRRGHVNVVFRPDLRLSPRQEG